MLHVLFLRERSVSESNGIRKDSRIFEISLERESGRIYDEVIEERVHEMREHPAHGPTNRYLPKENKLQRLK